MQARPIMAVVAVLFAALTVAAYGSGTGPWTTGAAGPDVINPTQHDAEAIQRLQAGEPSPTAAPVATTTPTSTAAVPQAPAKDPAPAKRGKVAKTRKAESDDSGDDDGGGEHERDHGKGHGLGNTYCQSLKGTGGPAFGHCIAAKAHELHQHGKHR